MKIKFNQKTKIVDIEKMIFFILIFLLICCNKNKSTIGPNMIDYDMLILTDDEMVGFELISEYTNHIVIEENYKLHEVIEQEWHKTEEDSNQIVGITYCQFNTCAKAFQSIAYSALRGNSWPYIWGSIDGTIKLDGSWVGVYEPSAFYFVRENIGIRIYSPLRFNEKDQQIMVSIYNIMQKKINYILSRNISAYETYTKKNQISNNEYQYITRNLESLQIMENFTLFNSWDSKWIIDSTNFVMGRRKEWTNNSDAVMGIDICKLNSNSLAIQASENMSKNTWQIDRIFQLDNLDSLKQILKEWNYFGFDNNITVVAYKKNIAYHIYYFDPEGIDKELVYSVYKKLSIDN